MMRLQCVRLQKLGNVVLVEITDVSIYQEIEKELRMLKDWNVNIAGCVGVE